MAAYLIEHNSECAAILCVYVCVCVCVILTDEWCVPGQGDGDELDETDDNSSGGPGTALLTVDVERCVRVHRLLDLQLLLEATALDNTQQ